MINSIEFLNLPTKIGLVLVAAFFVMQIIGELLEFKGKTVPELIKLRKRFARKRQERKMLHYIPLALDEMKASIKEWTNVVNTRFEQGENRMATLTEKLEKNNQDTLSLLIDSKRSAIISFASVVADDHAPVTREQFKRIFKLYEEYEALIEANGLTNGEIDVAYRIITEAYERNTRSHTFMEDLRGY